LIPTYKDELILLEKFGLLNGSDKLLSLTKGLLKGFDSQLILQFDNNDELYFAIPVEL